ncbi:MAG: PD-(D/E)XK nuclease family protein [Crocinitomicaceae bacterium]|nr:PD-(D/E)XK nuclease family protein [Crocinitomicaceae bacterium]
MNFTDKIAAYIKEEGLIHKDLIVVLPSQRAKKYLSASLFDLYKKPILSPQLITMDALIRSNSNRTILDKTRLLVKLFSIQLEIAKSDVDHSFDDFLEWGSILLSDFDELDRYLVGATTTFKDLHNIKELEYWKIDTDEHFVVSDARKRFLEFWDRLPYYYERLNEQLTDENATYMGNAYKYLSQNIDLLFKDNKNAHYLFVGFNALSTAETSIIKQLNKMGRGHVLLDADVFYVANKNHEAGEFIRKQLSDFDKKELPFIEDQLLHKSMKIEVVECAQQTGQIKVAASRLLELSDQEIAQTAIVLADESLIGPLLKNIPKKVGKANITLGMPMKGTAVKNWVDVLFSIQATNERSATSAFYYADLKRFLNHPFIVAGLNQQEKEVIQKMEERIVKNNWVYVSLKTINLSEKLQKITDLAKENWQGDWKLALQNIRSLNQLLYRELSNENQFEKALIQSFDTALIEFENIAKEGLPSMSLRSFKSLFSQHWSNKGIAYHGNPIDGLQIMGLLETRLLDFKNIICIGMNEGMMPPTNPIQSMFPMDLRRYVGLPLPRDKQGLFAHHFYRLLHVCEHLLVTYSAAKESIGSNEKSRYLVQIEKELARKNTAINWQTSFYAVPMEEEKLADSKSIPKDEAILKRMDELFTKSTSFSTLSKYVNCPLDFYYRYVLEFGEEDSVEEEMEDNTFGTILHKVLERLYAKHAKYKVDGNINPTGGQPLRKSDIVEMKAIYGKLLEEEYLLYFNKDETAFRFGKNQLSYKMAQKMLTDFLDQELAFIEAPNTVVIHSLEKKINYPLELELNGEKKSFNLNGTIDRVDEVNGQIRLVDYKSGGSKEEKRKLTTSKNEPDWRVHFSKASHLSQLLMYCYLYYHIEKVMPSQAGIFSMRAIKSGLLEMNLQHQTIEEMIAVYPTWLQELFEELYDTSIPFEHDANKFMNFCLYCV